MPTLSPRSRSIIHAARHGDDPSPADRTRLRRAIALQVGAGVAAGAATASASAAAGAAGATAGIGGVAAKIIVAAAVLGLGTAGYYVAVRPPPPPPAPAVVAAPHSAPSAPRIAVARPANSEPSVVVLPVEVSAEPSSASPCAPRPAASPSDLEREVAQLREAQEALRDGKPEAAMTVLDEQHADVLAEERAAMRVFTLCRLGKTDEGRAEAARFLATWPKSPQAPRVKTACAQPGY